MRQQNARCRKFSKHSYVNATSPIRTLRSTSGFTEPSSEVICDFLLFDCTKGYNLMSWKWIRRVLESAQCPAELMHAVMHSVKGNSSVILLLHQFTCAPATRASGLDQGCPPSCVLYVICVDPFLEFLRTVDGVDFVTGFCDDWTRSSVVQFGQSVACKSSRRSLTRPRGRDSTERNQRSCRRES